MVRHLALALLLAVAAGLTGRVVLGEQRRLRKVTDVLRRRSEELAAANAALEAARRAQVEFVAVTNHELRTPLTAIRGFAATLRHRWDEMDDDLRMAAVEAIDQQSQRLEELVADLLTVSSMRAGPLALTPRVLPLAEALSQAAAIADVLAAVRCDPEVTVRADSTRLLQVLTNLLTNARKYGAPPYVMTGRTEGDRTIIEVIDHGPGVPEGFVPIMFDEFTQASVGETRTADGTGLGLAIVRYLVTALEGSVTYRRGEHGGAVFTVDLPAR